MEQTSTIAQSAIETTTESLSLLRKTNCKGPTSKSLGPTKATPATTTTTTTTKGSSINLKGRVPRKESILCNKDKFTNSESANNSSTAQQLLAAAQQQQQSSPVQQQCKRAPKPRRRVATMAQRRAANIRERRRMFNLNSAFDRLRKKVPSFAYEKRLSRIETLKLAIMYIRFMDDLVKDDAYAEKYKQLTANYGVGGSAAGGPLGVASSGGFLTTSSYLSLYGCVDSASPSPDRLQHYPHHQLHHQATAVQSNQMSVASQQEKQQQPFGAANTTGSTSSTNDAGEDGEQSPPAGQRPHLGSSSGSERVQLCTDAGCAGSIVTNGGAAAGAVQLPHHYRVGRPAAAGLARNSSASLILKSSPSAPPPPPPPSSMACCSSPALSSSTTCNSSNFNSDSPDLSPQVHQHPPPPQQQQPARPIVCSPSMDYYQQPYDSYPLDQTSFYGGVGEPAASQPSGHASKMFYYGGAGAGLSEDTNHRGHQGQRAHDYCTAGGGGGGGAQLVTEPASARHAMAEQHAGQLGYTLHSLQAR